MKNFQLAFILCAAAASPAAADNPGIERDPGWDAFLEPGTVIGFVGDSITHNHPYHQYVQLFLATRYPDRGLWTINLGLSGDTAVGALKRYESDIAPHRVDAAFIHFGMNDVGRDAFKGRLEPLTEEELTPRRDRYTNALSQLGSNLVADGARAVAILSPTIFDDARQTGWDKPGERPHLNGELAQYGVVGRQIARQRGWQVVDLHTPLDETAVPFPDDALALAGFPELNLQVLRVDGLAEGAWTLAIDGVETVTRRACEWALGVGAPTRDFVGIAGYPLSDLAKSLTP